MLIQTASTTWSFTLSIVLEKPSELEEILHYSVTKEHSVLTWTLKAQVASYGLVITELSCSAPPNHYTKGASFDVEASFETQDAEKTRQLCPANSELSGGSKTLKSIFEGYETFLAQNNEVTMNFKVKYRGPIAKFSNEKTRDFSGETPGVTDTVLIVGEEKERFHVNRGILITHATYFQTMFNGAFRESRESEIELKGIDPETFQQLLEILYLRPNIHENNVENLLDLARIYDAQPVTEQCQKFINGENALPKKEKLRLREEYFGKC